MISTLDHELLVVSVADDAGHRYELRRRERMLATADKLTEIAAVLAAWGVVWEP